LHGPVSNVHRSIISNITNMGVPSQVHVGSVLWHWAPASSAVKNDQVGASNLEMVRALLENYYESDDEEDEDGGSQSSSKENHTESLASGLALPPDLSPPSRPGVSSGGGCGVVSGPRV